MRGALFLILLAPWDLLLAQTGCPVMNFTNVFIQFSGETTNCSHLSGTCEAGEEITFTASSFNYSFSCAPHTFTWHAAGQQLSGQEVAFSFLGPGAYPVTLTVNNGVQTFTTSANVTVAPVSCGAPNPLFLTTEPAQPTSATPITLHFMKGSCDHVVGWSLDGNVISLASEFSGSCIGPPTLSPRSLFIGHLPAGTYIARTTYNGMIDPIASACGQFIVADAAIPALDEVMIGLLALTLAVVALVALRRM